jgi:ribosome-binding factor A
MYIRSIARRVVLKRPSHRIERVNVTIKEILSELLLDQIKDPRVGLVTITSVKVSSDFSSAKVHFTVMGDEASRADTERGLRSAKNFMRKTVADELKLHHAPDLKFVYDDSLDRAMRIEKALRDDPPQSEEADGDEGKEEPEDKS